MKLPRMGSLPGRLPLALIFLVGLAAGAALDHWMPREAPEESGEGYPIREGGYKLINPLLECEVARETLEHKELRPFKVSVEKLVAEKYAGGKVDEIAVYWRDLNNGPWFGIREKDTFTPASLLKVPLLIAALKQAESDPFFLSRTMTYRGGEDANAMESVKSSRSIQPGKTYTVDELLTYMIACSDNNAAGVLMEAMEPSSMDHVFLDLGLSLADYKTLDAHTSVKQYAAFFRILYNASYLGREMSERALEYLTAAEFQDGLAAGIPPGTVIAHKFGERAWEEVPGILQLHEAGIIYHPSRPYLLCVMTRGSDMKVLSSCIADISSLVWKEISRQMENKGRKQ